MDIVLVILVLLLDNASQYVHLSVTLVRYLKHNSFMKYIAFKNSKVSVYVLAMPKIINVGNLVTHQQTDVVIE